MRLPPLPYNEDMRWLLLLVALILSAQSKYSGPRPAEQDLPYLLHASNLVATESGEAREEKRKDDMANIVAGAASAARTPLSEPIFLFSSSKIPVEKLALYEMDVKNGNREIVFPTNPRKQKDAPQPIRLSVQRLEPGLFRLEATKGLDNGEYCLSPSGSQQVFCFQVY